MTRAKFYEGGDIATIDIVGHAGFNPGNDIVCAGISTLCDTFNNTIVIMVSKGLVKNAYIKRLPGDYHVEVILEPKYKREWKAVKLMFLTGLRMIEESFPNYLKVRYKSVECGIDKT